MKYILEEWDCNGIQEYHPNGVRCICGSPLKKPYTIRHKISGYECYVGSSCIDVLRKNVKVLDQYGKNPFIYFYCNCCDKNFKRNGFKGEKNHKSECKTIKKMKEEEKKAVLTNINMDKDKEHIDCQFKPFVKREWFMDAEYLTPKLKRVFEYNSLYRKKFPDSYNKTMFEEVCEDDDTDEDDDENICVGHPTWMKPGVKCSRCYNN